MVEPQGDDPCVPPYRDGPQTLEDELLRKDAGLSRLSSVRPLCHTDQAPPRPASRLKGVYYEKQSARLTAATPVKGTHGKGGHLFTLEKGGSEKEPDGAFGSGSLSAPYSETAALSLSRLYYSTKHAFCQVGFRKKFEIF